MSDTKDPNRVYYRAGGFEQSRPILHGADAKKTFEFIPIVDVSTINSPDASIRKKLATEIGRAVTEVGFFYAINPPVNKKLMDDSFNVIKKFFDLPLETKNKYNFTQSPCFKGYMPSKTQEKNAPDRDSFAVGTDFSDEEQQVTKLPPKNAIPLNQWPDDVLPEFRHVFYAYYRECFDFAKALVRIFALALDLEETAFDKIFEAPLTDVLIQHYCPSPDRKDHEEILFPHADFSAFTLLLNQKGLPGLEVLNANGIWVPAPPIDHAYVVNTGSYFEFLSNSRFPATVHRVHTKLGVERFSFPIFFSPDPATFIRPHPALVKDGEDSEHIPHHIGQRYIKGLVHNAPNHPWVQSLKASGIKEEDYKWELLSQPFGDHVGA
ncbi:2OG-Fe(II)oxygenase superfamily protein [Phlyctema vagabunda]|uniref:2OG-Fe(II)oxygenase superfamily protein n=1 Tax=Phlyctema vagabunda TaxID=108571 RepID=A0ABR4PED3_9HELO